MRKSSQNQSYKGSDIICYHPWLLLQACSAIARIYPRITSVHTCLQETESAIWNLLMKSGRCPRMKFASSLGALLTIQIPSKHMETLLSQSSSFLRQNMHTHMDMSIYTLLSICEYNFQKKHNFIVSEYF